VNDRRGVARGGAQGALWAAGALGATPWEGEVVAHDLIAETFMDARGPGEKGEGPDGEEECVICFEGGKTHAVRPRLYYSQA